MRKRMLNPDFFTDPDIVANFDAFGRLFYQGLWCVAEDSGCLELNPLFLKMKIFPGDNIELDQIQIYIDKLVDLDKIIDYEVDNKKYGWIKNFHKHQTLNRPSPPTVPLPSWIIFHGENEFSKRHEYYYEVIEKRPVQDASMTEERQDQEVTCTEEKLKEVKGNKKKLSEEEENTETEAKEGPPPTPYQEISDLYNRYCPDMPRVIKMSDRRKEHLRARWKEVYKLVLDQNENIPEDLKEQILSVFELIFQKAGSSRFMNGKNDRGWKADFEWMIKNNNNFTKVLEGKYDNDKFMNGSNSPPKSKTRRRIERAREKDKRRNQTG